MVKVIEGKKYISNDKKPFELSDFMHKHFSRQSETRDKQNHNNANKITLADLPKPDKPNTKTYYARSIERTDDY